MLSVPVLLVRNYCEGAEYSQCPKLMRLIERVLPELELIGIRKGIVLTARYFNYISLVFQKNCD